MEWKDMTLEERKEKIKEMAEKTKLERKERLQNMWENLKPFTDENSFVPELPKPLTQFHINKLIKCGAIPLEDLKHEVLYFGDYRNSKFGLWDAQLKLFKIIRFKYGGFLMDTCHHFQDDDGFALFVPLREATEDEIILHKERK